MIHRTRLRNAAKFLRLWAVVFAFAVLILPTLGSGDASNSNERFNKLGHQIMCSCGCGQILLECNHVGCPASDGMRQELRVAMNANSSDQQVYDVFIQKYGPVIMAAPVFHGFNILAWVLPFAVLLVGSLAAASLIYMWKQRNLRQIPAPPPALSDAVRDRIRRETEI
jgi:cytochrome c-type biogenesis protein CcmH